MDSQGRAVGRVWAGTAGVRVHHWATRVAGCTTAAGGGDPHRYLCVLPPQPDLLPHVLWRVCPLYGFYVQVAAAVLLLDGGISAVGQGAAAAVAESGHIVLVATKVLSFCLRPETTVVVGDQLPNHLQRKSRG